MRSLFIILFFGFCNSELSAQCCGAGSSCPIAGGVSQGVLMQRQFEVASNFQSVSTKHFFHHDSPEQNFLDKYSSKYSYFKIAYGLSDRLTFSVETGYFFSKEQIGLNKRDTISSSGIGDLILFPRYSLYTHSNQRYHTEIIAGVGIKIPLGMYNDSLQQVEPFSGSIYYVRKPPAVQPSTGSQDFLFYSMLMHSWNKSNFRIAANALFIQKGWNPIGEKTGNYLSVGILAGKTVFKKLRCMLQIKGEYIDSVKLNPELNLYGYYNYDTKSTGSKKVFVLPQVGYSFGSLSFFVSGEIPVYQFVNGTQIGSQYLFTAGFSYRFFAFSKSVPSGTYYCPMHPDVKSEKPGLCPSCHMELILKK